MTLPAAIAYLLVLLPAAAISAGCIYVSRPLLRRYTLAQPNARSSHRIPTPQGAGIAVIVATLLVATVWAHFMEVAAPTAVLVATLFVALIGLADDIQSIPVLPRLLAQAAAVGMIIFTAPPDLAIVSGCPLSLERGLLLIASLWFLNVVNFMDGLDLMTVVEVVPITIALMLLGWLGDFPQSTAILAAALCGAMLGFAPFNRPVAKVFLGDVGSLPIGLLIGWCLLQLAWQGHLIAACLLPLYYLADATITLILRLVRGEPFWIAHRSHFYQRATDNGYTVRQVVTEVLVLNAALSVLAIASARAGSIRVGLVTSLAGVACVVIALRRFSRRRSN